MKSEASVWNRACASSAAWRWSAGRSRGSWIDRAAATTITSREHPNASAASTIRPSRGSTGRRARRRPSLVSRPSASAPSSSSSSTPSRIERASGGSMNGNAATSPRPSAVICRMTDARLVRRISGSVNSGRAAKSSASYSRMHVPGATRPQRPARWLADACDTGSIGRRWTLSRLL